MTTLETTIRKSDHYGWECKSSVVLEEGITGNGMLNGEIGTRVLNFTTYKIQSGIIATYASVSIDVKHDGYSSSLTAVFSDYHKRYNVTPCKMANEKLVRAAHAKALETAQEHMDAAKAMYAAKVAA